MNKKQQDRARGKLQSNLNAAAIFTQQPGLEEASATEGNNTITEERNKDIKPEINNAITEEHHTAIRTSVNNTVMEEFNNASTEQSNTGIMDEVNNGSKRGPKKKGEFKKVTLNLDVELNTALDKYILSLKQQALEDGTEPPNKSEWVRDLVEDKLRELGIME